MLTNKRHDQIVNAHRIAADAKETRLMHEADRARAETIELDSLARESYGRWNQEKKALVEDLNKLSAEVAELRSYKARTVRTVEVLQQSNAALAGQVGAYGDIAEKLEEAIEEKASLERELKAYHKRDEARRKKAAKERDAEVKTAKAARKLAAENGEQWAVEAILSPKLGLFG